MVAIYKFWRCPAGAGDQCDQPIDRSSERASEQARNQKKIYAPPLVSGSALAADWFCDVDVQVRFEGGRQYPTDYCSLSSPSRDAALWESSCAGHRPPVRYRDYRAGYEKGQVPCHQERPPVHSMLDVRSSGQGAPNAGTLEIDMVRAWFLPRSIKVGLEGRASLVVLCVLIRCWCCGGFCVARRKRNAKRSPIRRRSWKNMRLSK